MTKDEAERKALEARPRHRIIETKELKNCFVVSVLPKNYNEAEDGLYVGGAVRVDKKTGACREFNPLLEGNIQ